MYIMLLRGLFFIQAVHFIGAFFSRTTNGKYLNVDIWKRLESVDWYTCVISCERNPECVSYNYNTRMRVCELTRYGLSGENDLMTSPTWTFQQIRPSSGLMKEQRGIEDCACNCGTGQQCSIKPGLGDTPELAAQSCSEIFTNRPGPLQDGPYYLKANKLPVYCHMTAIDGCEGEGGWTLVMKINGSMGTFAYSSSRWSSQYEYNTEAGGDLDETETRLGTFRSLIFQQICLGMKTPDSSSIRWISYHLSSGANLFETMITPHAYVDFASSRPEDWEKLIPSATIKTMETKDGINVVPDGDNGAKARIGIVGKGAQGWDSYIGFGTVGTSANPTLSCGNVDGSKHTPAFGYILVK